LVMLISTAFRVAREYKMQYILPAVAIVIIVLINGLFLFAEVPGVIGRLDVSLILYSAVVLFLYWCCFIYARKGLIGIFKTSIFDSLDMGIVLFGYDDHMFLCNERIRKYVPGIVFNENLTFEGFIDRCGIRLDKEKLADDISFQWIRENSTGDFVPFLCNYKTLKNAGGRKLGKLMTFEDARLETDFISGFNSWESFNMKVSEMKFNVPAVVTCCDINGLSVINNTYGMGKGDQIIGELAGLHRDEFPADTYFVRGNDANLISICAGITEPDAVEIMERVRRRFSGTFQYALIVVEDEDPDMVDAILRAEKNVATWKLMDNESMRSNTLNSLIRALKECDADTESHVRRTQYLGIRLSRRIGLTDTDEARLALLCVLHDIGKIGVPLELLNKPGKLTEDEWIVVKSHVHKGYEIARSSTDYTDIAEEILHHHERWDGKGYPDGLKKETIPILSRIIAVVDAYDAMVNKRPYKNKMTVAEAKQELIDNAGTQFDSTVVSEFIQLLEEEGIGVNDAETVPQDTPAIFELNYKPSSDRNKIAEIPENEGVYDVPFIRYLIDSNQKIIQVDDGFEAFTGYSEDDISKLSLGQPDLIPERFRAYYYVKVTEQLARRQMAYLEHTLQMKNGKERDVICLGRPYYDSAAMTERTEIIVFDALKCHTVARFISKEATMNPAKNKGRNRLIISED
ncbi:MAG: HD domain-containing phosphohydrolase, partial [Lentihominibacter sp.]